MPIENNKYFSLFSVPLLYTFLIIFLLWLFQQLQLNCTEDLDETLIITKIITNPKLLCYLKRLVGLVVDFEEIMNFIFN